MSTTLDIVGSGYRIFRVKCPLVKNSNGELSLSASAEEWAKLGWEEGTVLEIRQDDKDDFTQLTIRKAPKSLRDSAGV